MLAAVARLAVFSLLSATLVSAIGCANYRSELQRGQGYYNDQQYEIALALWRDLEPDQDSLEKNERVRYAYLRGMTDFRLGYRPDARYWLGLAAAGEKLTPSSLSSDESERLGKTLNELNQEVYGTGKAPKAEANGPGSTGEERNVRPGQKATDPTGQACNWSSECPSGFICQDRVCVEL